MPLVGASHNLDPRSVRQACEALGLDWSKLPGPEGPSEADTLGQIRFNQTPGGHYNTLLFAAVALWVSRRLFG